MVFDDELYTAPFTREDTILPNWTYLVHRNSQSGEMDNIDLKDTWFTTDLEEDPSETPTNVPIVAPENNINMITSSQSVTQVQ